MWSSQRLQQGVLDHRVAADYHHRERRSGAPRLALASHDDGLPVDRKTVATSLQLQGRRAKAAQKFKAMTNFQHTLPVAPSLQEHGFTATTPEVGRRQYVPGSQRRRALSGGID